VSVTVTLEFHARPDTAQTLYDALGAILGDTRAFEGCESVSVHRDLADTTAILLYEQWGTVDQQQAYMAWRQERGDIDKLMAMLAEPPAIRSWENCSI
jgi:quinol monooxygenase YgiN